MKTNTLPLVSIGIPTFNGNTSILTSLTSIWAQHYPNLEIIISDNCSTDNTQEVVQKICENHPEIKYFRQEANIGMIPNFGFLLRKASGKYFMWVSDDDQIEPGVLLRYVTFLETNDNYSLVSGKIQYWKDDVLDIIESGFSFEQNSRSLRTTSFYFKVIYGGLMHGMMRRELGVNVPLRKVIGNDYHFVAGLAFLGKIKNFDFVGYNKKFGGLSSDFKRYAKAMGESKLAGYFPHIKMAADAFTEIVYRSPVYSPLPLFSRLVLGTFSFSGVLYCYYVGILVLSRISKYIINPVLGLLKVSK